MCGSLHRSFTIARQPRLDIPGIAQHVIQPGNDRRPCFFRESDYLRYLQALRELSMREHCAVHAYVLMTNHVHLLVTPGIVAERKDYRWSSHGANALGARDPAIRPPLGRRARPAKIGGPRKDRGSQRSAL